MTESAPKNLLVFTIIVSMLVVGVYTVTSLSSGPSTEQKLAKNFGQEIVVGRVGLGYFNFELANTEAKRVKGLSGKLKLPDTDAMLFVFDSPGEQCVWMKDMKFNLDILWFSEGKKLVYEKRDVAPSTYPEKFCSDTPAKYVVEMSAGVADKNELKIGDKLDVEL